MTSSILTKEGVNLEYPWMFGRSYDLLFFFFPALLGLALFSLYRYTSLGTSALWTALLLEAFGAGAFHWGPTWFAYFDKKNRDYWITQPVKSAVFFWGPPVLFAVCISGNVYCPWLITLITMIWALQHLIQQNVGILLLYHNQGRGEVIVDRQTEMRSQQVPAIFFASIFYWRSFFGAPINALCLFIGGTLGICALYYVCKYLFLFSKQVKEGASINVPALGFWVLSVLAFLPFAFFGKKFEDSFFIPVTMHWFQYIGLNYMLVRNKYAAGESSEDNRINLPNFSPILLFFITCSVGVLLLAIIKLTLHMPGVSPTMTQMIAGVYLATANTHYLLDAFLWRFR
ncbi:MAG TPA: hypothetical protein PKZ32_15425, partial [Candidatus Melainabacteria bacterium]|nr:hypothetical protein [Candidatus Melainabacteria bacterium]